MRRGLSNPGDPNASIATSKVLLHEHAGRGTSCLSSLGVGVERAAGKSAAPGQWTTGVRDQPYAAIRCLLATCKFFASILRHENTLLAERAG